MALTTSDLLTNIKRRSQLPDDGGTLSDTDILAMASDELQNVIAPRLMALHEWHYAFSYTQSLASTREYRIHHRSAAQGIVSVELLDGSTYRFLPLRHPLMQRASDGENYAVLGNKIVLSDAVPTSGTIRIRALLRPSRLVAVSSTGPQTITAVAGQVLSVANTTWVTASDQVDIYWQTSPYEVVALDVDVDSVVANTSITIDSADYVPSSENVSNRVYLAEQTDRVPLPDELHDYLAQRVAIRCMEARGFTQDMQNHLRKLQDLEMAFDRLSSPRVRGEFKAISPEEYNASWRA